MKGMGRVAFLAQLDQIKAELDAGWPIKAVFQKRADKLAMSYAPIQLHAINGDCTRLFEVSQKSADNLV